MSTIDISRWATDRRKRYSGVRMQQGRVLTDDDFNEAERLDAEDSRQTRVDVIGASGSPDFGFQVQNPGPIAGGALSFRIAAGTFYLGGLRLENPTAEEFELQKDWLPFVQATDGIPAVGAGTTRTDLVWLEAWQQNVSAVEDSELLEKALGGPDSAQRMRTMRRVRVTPGTAASSCGPAWTAATTAWAAAGEGIMRPDLEIGTNATLTVTFAPGPGTPNLCTPSVANGYLGAENQAIRVQLNGANTFTWGFDNASALYRVLVKTDTDAASPTNGLRVVIELQTEPRDTMHWPRAGQLIELLPWSAALPNREKLAELSGLYGRVTKSYDPITRQIHITPEAGAQVPAGFDSAWQGRPAPDIATFYDGAAASKYVFMRVWDRGDDTASGPRIAIPAGPYTLGHTGVRVEFSGAPRRNNDFWIIAARPATNDVVVPWILKGQAPPIGLKRYRAPLALIRWTATAGGVVTGVVTHDCRQPFLPLTKMRGCCTVTVGDNSHSFGQFSSIQAAVNALPPEGGTVCVLNGMYTESVLINQRVGVRIHGCGPRTRIRAAGPAGGPLPAFLIQRSSGIAIETMAIESGPMSAVHITNSRDVAVRGCLIQMRDQATLWPALFSRGDDITIEGNTIEVLPADGVPPSPTVPPAFGDWRAPASEQTPPPVITLASATRGGIQVAGGSDRVSIVRNVIRGGIWNGITLGSLRAVGSDGSDDTPDDPDLRDPCFPCRPVDITDPEDDGGAVRYESAGDLYDIVIDGNRITDMGSSGISVIRFFDLLQGGDLITVHGLLIAGNVIARCMRRDVTPPRDAMQWLAAYGGIALAAVSDLRILRNEIISNGRSHLDPICGVYAIVAAGLQLDDNRIAGNGRKHGEPATSARNGIRGGVHVWMVLPAKMRGVMEEDGAGLFGSTAPACLVRDNMIDAPLGRALTFLAIGASVVARNRLITRGCTAAGLDLLAATVLIGNLGIGSEWTLGLAATFGNNMSGKALDDNACQRAKYSFLGYGASGYNAAGGGYTAAGRFQPPLARYWASGKTLFTENQVTLDLSEQPAGFALSSILIFTLDDCGMTDNQCELLATSFFCLVNSALAGLTVREADNRFAETWMHVLFSAASIGMMNTTTDNQATHCLLARAMPNLRVFKDNLALLHAFCPGECGERGYGEAD